MEQFEAYIKQHLPYKASFHPHYNDALAQMLLAGGKRFRPKLLLSIVKALAPEMLPNALAVAYAVELIHTYSLIHDDLPSMDDAPLRRGHETLHITYDEVTAILVGDALNTHAFEVLSNAPLAASIIVKLIRILATASGSGGMVLGQALDCHFEHQTLTEEKLSFIHNHKTGALIAASLQMGGVVCGVDESESQQLYDVGLVIGLMFQIKDDIIDVTQSSEVAGKTTGNDGDKNSYVNLLGLEGAKQRLDEYQENLDKMIEGLYQEPLKKALREIVRSYF